MNIVILALIFFTVICNVIAQLFLKIGMGRIGFFSFNLSNILPIALQVSTSIWIISGLGIYLISVISWLLVLSRSEVSIAYPMSSLGYIFTAIAAYFFLGENFSMVRVLGIVIIIFGVYLVAKG